MKQKIAFFDIDGTLTSEVDGSIPLSVYDSISQARCNGHLMFINTGRCMQNVEQRFRDIGFDGFICGCGTNIYLNNNNSLNELFHISQPHNIIKLILDESRKYELDILFESKYGVYFDRIHDFYTEKAFRQFTHFVDRNYDMTVDLESPDFRCDKFVIWFKNIDDLPKFRLVSDKYFDCIDRGGYFREFVPKGYSKASGIQVVLDYYNLSIEQSYAFGDSNNDLSMLSYVKHSVAMGNSLPKTLFDMVSHVTTNSSCDGISNSLHELGFI